MEVVASGAWLYDRTSPMPVHIVRLAYDFWYAIGEADGDLDAGEFPNLNHEGRAYHVSFHNPAEGRPSARTRRASRP